MILALSFDACLFHHVTGTLKGYNQLLNLVLDAAVECVQGISFLTLSLCVCITAQHEMSSLGHVM